MSPQGSSAVLGTGIDTHDLSRTGHGDTEAVVRDVQGSVRPEGHPRWERQARGHCGERAIAIDAHHLARVGSPGAGEASDRVGFQGVQTTLGVKRHAQHGGQARCCHLDAPARRDLIQILGTRADREGAQRADIEVPVVGNPCWSLPVVRRNEQSGHVEHAGDVAIQRNAVQFLVIGFVGVKRAADRDHAVPGAVRLEVADVGIGDGVRFQEGAEVGHGSNRAVCIHAKEGVVGPEEPVRAAGAGLHPVEGPVDELDVSHPLVKPPEAGFV